MWNSFDKDRESVSARTSPTSSVITTSAQSLRASVHVINQVEVEKGIICGLATHQNRILLLLYPENSIEAIFDGSASTIAQPQVPQIVVMDVGESLGDNTCMQQLTADQISVISLEESEEVNREEVMLRCCPETRFQGIGLGGLLLFF